MLDSCEVFSVLSLQVQRLEKLYYRTFTMPDLQQRIFDIIHQPQLALLATVTEKNNPWVRYVVTVGDENLTIRCATLVESRKVKQIENNPNVHVTCGVNSLQEMQPYLQIQGKARVATDKEERHGFWNEMLASIFDGPDDPRYSVIVIEPERIEYCTQGSYEPEVWMK